MKFLPYEKFYLTTSQAPSEVVARLVGNTAPKSHNLFRWTNKSTKPYEGSVDGSNFRLSRIIRYRNSFLPVITGQITADTTGTRVHVRMRMNLFVCVFMGIWLSLVTFAGIAVVSHMLSERKFHSGIFGVLIMFAFGYGLALGGFKYESSKSKKFFAELLQASYEK